MIIFSNTTPFIALASIGRLDLMPKLFGKIHVAAAVIEECAEGGRILVPNLCELEWIVPVEDSQATRLPVQFELDRGEKQTIELALARKADKVIMDERLGRRYAEYSGLSVTGTLGVLMKAKSVGLIASFRAAAQAMRTEGIYFNAGLIERLAKLIEE
ncbi:MAG: DUF3368 domain-containing protein [Methylococcales bacterium]